MRYLITYLLLYIFIFSMICKSIIYTNTQYYRHADVDYFNISRKKAIISFADNSNFTIFVP